MSKKPFGASTVSAVLGLAFIALIGIRTISTPEIWTHLAQGRANLPISYLEVDTPVNTTHLYDKIVFGLWNVGGAPALILVNVICLLAAFVLLLKVSAKWGGGLSQGFALLLCGHLLFRSVDVDPKTVMMLFTALFVYLALTLKKPALLFGFLIPLQILWTNLHGSFLFGPVIALLATLQARQDAKGSGRRKEQGVTPSIMGGLVVALLIATLVNPYFIGLHKQVVASVTHPSPVYWLSLLRGYFQIPSQNPLIFLVLVLGAGGLLTLKKKLPIMLTTLAVLGSFLVIRSTYAVQLFTVVAFPFMVLSLTAVGDSLRGSFKQSKLLVPLTQGILVLLIVLSAIPIVSNCAYTKLGSTSSFGLGVQEELYPAGVEALITHEAFPEPEKTINLATDGGYLAFNYDRKVLVDHRPGRYSPEMLVDLNDMLLGDADAYDRIYIDHRPEAIILNTLDPSSAQGVVTLLFRRIWKLAYFDGTTAVLLLNKEELAPLLNNTELQSAGLAKVEAARAEYASRIEKGCQTGNPAELIGAARVFLALNRPVESKAIFSLLVQGNSKVSSSWVGLGSSQLLLKEFDAAMKSLEKATELAPDSLQAWVGYAQACKYAEKSDELKRAREKVQQLVEKDKKQDAKQQDAGQEDVEQQDATELGDVEIPE